MTSRALYYRVTSVSLSRSSLSEKMSLGGTFRNDDRWRMKLGIWKIFLGFSLVCAYFSSFLACVGVLCCCYVWKLALRLRLWFAVDNVTDHCSAVNQLTVYVCVWCITGSFPDLSSLPLSIHHLLWVDTDELVYCQSDGLSTRVCSALLDWNQQLVTCRW